MFMVMFVLNNPHQLDDVLTAMHAIGIDGVTISDSTGAHRRHLKRVGHRYLMKFGMPTEIEEQEGHFTLWTIVPTQEAVNACLAAAETVIGDFADPDTGVFAAWPVAFTKGVRFDGKMADKNT
jgi:hypothetical protein